MVSWAQINRMETGSLGSRKGLTREQGSQMNEGDLQRFPVSSENILQWRSLSRIARVVMGDPVCL